jgi:hypothetical protein
MSRHPLPLISTDLFTKVREGQREKEEEEEEEEVEGKERRTQTHERPTPLFVIHICPPLCVKCDKKQTHHRTPPPNSSLSPELVSPPLTLLSPEHFSLLSTTQGDFVPLPAMKQGELQWLPPTLERDSALGGEDGAGGDAGGESKGMDGGVAGEGAEAAATRARKKALFDALFPVARDAPPVRQRGPKGPGGKGPGGKGGDKTKDRNKARQRNQYS